MADYCAQCSEELFGKDFRDLALHHADERAVHIAICEGCEGNVFNKWGECIDQECTKHLNTAQREPKVWRLDQVDEDEEPVQ